MAERFAASFNQNPMYTMFASDDGDYVRFSDYASLQKELAEARSSQAQTAVVAADEANRAEAAEASVTALSAEVERLRGALLRHGAHARNCERPRGPECDCGWDELSAALANEDTAR